MNEQFKSLDTLLSMWSCLTTIVVLYYDVGWRHASRWYAKKFLVALSESVLSKVPKVNEKFINYRINVIVCLL